jgi:hypothetical protein
MYSSATGKRPALTLNLAPYCRLVLCELLEACVTDTELQVFMYLPAIFMYSPLRLIPLALCFLSITSARNSDSSPVTKLSVATWESTIGTELEHNNSLINFISGHESAYVYCMCIHGISPFSGR